MTTSDTPTTSQPSRGLFHTAEAVLFAAGLTSAAIFLFIDQTGRIWVGVLAALALISFFLLRKREPTRARCIIGIVYGLIILAAVLTGTFLLGR